MRYRRERERALERLTVGERLEAVPGARAIGVASYGKTKQNLTIAFLFNGIGVPAAITGRVHPVWAMVAMISSVSLVLANSFGARLRPALLFALPTVARRGLRALAPAARVESLRALRDRRLAAVLALVAAAFLLGAVWVVGLGKQQAGMGAVAQRQAPKGELPALTGFYNGKGVRFAHTEASSPEVAKLLTRMTGSPVLVVPQLADVPRSALATVYVFANGVKGAGPMGFQADVFDSAPGTRGYSPLRILTLVRWAKGANPRELGSAAEVEAAARRGELTIEQTGVVINMPFLSWPGGGR